ncbi:MAG: HAD family hydrolase [Thermoplasmata archaeon]
MRKVNAVTFDLWDTLIKEVPGGSEKVAGLRIRRIGELLDSIGRPHDLDEIEEAHRKTGTFLELTWGKARDMPARDQVLFMLSCVECRLPGKMTNEDISRVEAIYADSLLDHPPELLPGAKEALRAAGEKGFKLGLISNTGKTPGSTLRTLMGRMGILEHFQVTTFSNEIMVRKPAEAAFKVTLERLKALPKATAHVGDHPDHDMAAAKKVGMHAVQVMTHASAPSGEADVRVQSLDGVVDALDSFG